LVTGYSTVGSGSFAYGYIKDGSTWTDFNYPGATYTYAYDVNDSGHVVGYLDGGPGTHAFLYDGTTWTLLDDPDAIAGTTQALGINDSGLIVGQFRDSSGYHGFLYDGGTWTTLDDPMSTSSTFAQGINDDGDIVGYFYDATGTHSFIASRAATVPEASTWSLMLCAFAALALVRRRRGVWQLANLARELQQRIEFSTFPAVSLSQVSEVHSFCIVGMLCAPAVLRRSMG
jgi:probable HAF family extracellular repeat protein